METKTAENIETVGTLNIDEHAIDQTAKAITRHRGNTAALALVPKGYEELKTMALDVYNSGLAPAALSTPHKVLVAMMTCIDLKLPITAGLANIAVINGRPMIWGTGAVALVRASGLCKFLRMRYDPELRAGVCETHRLGEPAPQVYRFTEEDAAKARLLGKKGPWSDGYKERMLVWKATSWCLRDVYGDVLLGVGLVQEDIPGQTLVEISPGEFVVKADTKTVDQNPLEDEPVIPIEGKPDYATDPDAFCAWFVDTAAAEGQPQSLRNLHRCCAADIEGASEEHKARMRAAYKAAILRLKASEF